MLVALWAARASGADIAVQPPAKPERGGAVTEAPTPGISPVSPPVAAPAAAPDSAQPAGQSSERPVALPPSKPVPPAPAALVLDLDAHAGGREGVIVASGLLPTGLSRGALDRLLPRVRRGEGLASGGLGDANAWAAALEALNVVLPRIASARIRLDDGRIRIEGRLRPGFSHKDARAALRSMLGPDWRLSFAAREVPPPAGLDIVHGPGSTRLGGLLPMGLSPAQALTIFGADAAADAAGLASGAEGDPGAWTRALAGLATLLRVHAEATARVEPGLLRIEGRLRPGQERARLAAWVRESAGPGWSLALESRETPAGEGTTRLDPVTLGTERLTDGRWLPVFDFEAGPRRCGREAERLQARAKLRFDHGESTLGPEAGPVLDRLAGLARHCREAGAFPGSPGLDLIIGGHTDAVGRARENRPLSETRAWRVLEALAERGVPREGMRAVGYGSARPVGDDATPEGRARNRRISFTWQVAPVPVEVGEQAPATALTASEPGSSVRISPLVPLADKGPAVGPEPPLPDAMVPGPTPRAVPSATPRAAPSAAPDRAVP